MEYSKGRSSSEDDAGIRKVGIQVKTDTSTSISHEMLKIMNINHSVQEIVAQLCLDCGKPYERDRLGLWAKDDFFDGTRYVTDENKWKIQNGAMLILKESLKTVAGQLYHKLLHGDSDGLGEIAKASEDIFILNELCGPPVHKTIYNKIIEICLEKNDDKTWCNGLRIILNMLKQKIVKRIVSDVVKHLTWVLENHKLVSTDLVLICIEMLAFIRRYKRLRYVDDIFENLYEILQRQESRDLQEAALQMLNHLVYFPNDPDEEYKALRHVVNSKIIATICEKVLMSQGSPTKGMQRQLYRYQCLTLRRYWSKKVTKIPKSDPSFLAILDKSPLSISGSVPMRKHQRNEQAKAPQQHLSLFRNFRASFRVSRQDFTSSRFARALSPPRRERTASSVFYTKAHKPLASSLSDEPFTFEFYGPIRYKVHEGTTKASAAGKEEFVVKSKASSLSSIPDSVREDSNAGSADSSTSKWNVSLLTVENLQFLAENDPQLYEKWSFHKGKRYLFADKITQMLCRLLEVGRPRSFDAPCDNYHPLAFHTYPYFLEELFCEALTRYKTTSKEMKARFESDEPKVIAILQQQMEYALASKPQAMETFRLILSGTAYEVVAEKKYVESRERFRYDLQHKPIYLEYREQCQPKILDMIRQHRLNFMKKGQKLPKVNKQGEIDKSSTYRTCLSKSGDTILVHDVGQAGTVVTVNDILDIEIGKSSDFYRQIRKYQDEHDSGFFRTWRDEQKYWSLLFSLKLRDGSYVNLCANSEHDLDYWQDGINYLLKKPMTSETFQKELQQFLDMDVRLHFLEAEGLPIPDAAPEVPPPPANYDFCYKKHLPQLQNKLKTKA